MLVAIVTIFASGQNQKVPTCTHAERLQVEKEASELRTWDALYNSYRKYGHCDDVDAAEGYSESKARILVDHWETLPRLAELIRKDKEFERFVRVEETMDMQDVAKIRENAAHKCPPGLTNICDRLFQRADTDIEEDGATRKP
jgi:hypothetical protein